MENTVLDYVRLAELRPGEKLTIGHLEIRRAGIVWVVKSGDIKRSFEKAPIALDWINKELERGDKALRRAKKFDVVVEQANGKTEVVGTLGKAGKKAKMKAEKAQMKADKAKAKAKTKVEKIQEKNQKIQKKVEKVQVKNGKMKDVATAVLSKREIRIAKKTERKAKRARNKIRKFFEFMIYTFSWILFMVFGFILFDMHLTMAFIPADIALGIVNIKSAIQSLFINDTAFLAAYVGVGVLGVLILLFSALSTQLHKTKFTKLWGVLLSLFALAGIAYVMISSEHALNSLITGIEILDRPTIAKLAFIGVNLIHFLIVVIFGWKKKEIKE